MVRRVIEDAAGEIRGSGGLVRTFIRHPNAANLLMMLMILIGVFSMLKINTQFFPSVDRPNVNIAVIWSGASAEDIEANLKWKRPSRGSPPCRLTLKRRRYRGPAFLIGWPVCPLAAALPSRSSVNGPNASVMT